MYPYLNTPWGTLELYTWATIAGAVCSVLVQIAMLWRFTRKKRSILLSGLYGLYSWIGGYASSLVRQLSYGKLLEGSLWENVRNGEGKHFIGIVLVCTLLTIPCTKIACRILRVEKENRQMYETATANALAVGILIQHIFVRLGCFFRGCCYGKYYNGVFSITIPNGEVTYPVFPVQLLEIFLSTLLFVFVIVLIRKKKDVFGITVMGYACNIFISEFFADKKGTSLIAGISVMQWCSILLFLLGGIYYIYKTQKRGVVSR